MFKTITSVLNKTKNPTEEEIAKISSYIFCRWLSGSPMSIFAANQINFYDNIPIENQYYLIKNVFAGKINYIPYPKNIKIEILKKIEYLSDFFKISFEKAQEYLEFISDKELNEIVDIYSTQELKNKK
jgi:hypothetical protein